MMPASTQSPRLHLLRATGWFTALTAVLAMLLGLQYLTHFDWPGAPDAVVYSVLAYTSHFALLALIPWVLLVVPISLLLPRAFLVLPLSVVLAALGLSWLLLDALLFAEHQFHLNALTVTILGTHTWLFGAIYLLMFAGLGAFALRSIWLRTAQPARRNRGVWLGAAALLALVVAQLQHAWADANYYIPITRFSHYLPGYQPVTAKGLLARYGLVDMARVRERSMLDQAALDTTGQNLDYPKTPLQCAPRPTPNLLIIVIDAMRADMLNPAVAPNLSHFAETAMVFGQHYSGGNSSRMGMFSLFYGLPSTYWQSIEALQIQPVMMGELQARGYDFGIFGSAPLYRPVSLDRTAFVGLEDLRSAAPDVEGGAAGRDQAIVEEWRQWLSRRESGVPFMGFLYFDAPTAKAYPEDYPSRFTAQADSELATRRADYRTSIHYVDSLFENVRRDLQRRGLLDSTVVLVTADHGEEFDDSGRGFNGHGTAYSNAQLQVPFVLHWPGRAAARYAHATSHNDWVVTVMQDLLGCTSPAPDYASGRSLFDGRDWPWLIAGSYHNFAILDAERVIVKQFGGTLEVRDRDYAIVDEPVLDRDVVAAALAETSRFFRAP